MKKLSAYYLALTAVGLFSLQFKISSKSYHSSAVSPKVSSPHCWPMFNIGVQRLSSREEVRSGKRESGLAPGTEYYKELSDTLPSVLRIMPNGTLDLLPTSRLQITGGSLSYLDCRIRLYDAADVKKCSSLRRKSQDGPLWMAFYGDSKVRDKFAMFLEITPNFNWYIYNNTLKEKTSTTWKAYNLIHGYKMQHSLSVAGDQDAKLDFIWAPRGFEIYDKSAPRGNELEFWAYKAPRVPSVVVVGFGSWSMSSGATTDSETLNKYSDYADVWRSMAKVLSVLAARTNVLAWAQSRSRDYVVVSRVNAASVNQEAGSKKHEKAALIQKLTRLLHYTRLLSSTAEWTDEVMHMALRNTGVTIWDSTMPMNLLNIKECQVLRDSGMTAYPTYFDHSCQDDIHSDSYTVEDENMMLINLLCNQYVGKVEGTYCCTE